MKIDHVHFYVEDARALRNWFVQLLGFQLVASGSSSHTRTEVVNSGSIYFVLSSPRNSTSPIAKFLSRHPPGVADLAFLVQDVAVLIKRALKHGVDVLQPVRECSLGGGSLKWGKFAAWGSLTHTILERSAIGEMSWIPTPVDWVEDTNSSEVLPLKNQKIEGNCHPLQLFTNIDHVVLNVAAGDLGQAARWYQEVLGFLPQQMFAIKTEQSGLCSQVMVHPGEGVQLPINEPTSANSQIQEFLNVNQGPGIQHIALRTSNILQAVAQLRSQGLPFIEVPPSYYTQLEQRYPFDLKEWAEIAAQQILVDWQQEHPKALLLQTFSQPIFREPTLFFEVIERRQQAKGFGEGNFRALFEAIEREQLQRGSLSTK
ncbi:4-hydroxyphenylpyruvate dioxygenase [Lyngbya aestuarii]|uniref:4-hydroxyphenylpyruvate dioxygenase n=1 Tax=Lyngbya aestuarii TaxID=118322 RepID=UPI00403DC6CB